MILFSWCMGMGRPQKQTQKCEGQSTKRHMYVHILYKLVVCLCTNIRRACLVGPAGLCSKFLFQKMCHYSKRVAY